MMGRLKMWGKGLILGTLFLMPILNDGLWRTARAEDKAPPTAQNSLPSNPNPVPSSALPAQPPALASNEPEIPIKLEWLRSQASPSKKALFTLEVAADPGFAKVVYTAEVPSNRAEFKVPGDGTYHWRLLRPQRPGDMAERSVPISGSFVALSSQPQTADTATEAEPRPFLSWGPNPSADRYRIAVYNEGKKIRELTTLGTSIALAREAYPLTAEVTPFQKERKVARYFHFDPSLSLKISKKNPPVVAIVAPTPTLAPASASAAVLQPSPVPGDQPSSAIPMPSDLPLADEASAAPRPSASPSSAPLPVAAVVDTSGLHRVHRVHLQVGAAATTIAAHSVNPTVESQQTSPSFGFGFWTQPSAILIFEGRADYFEHEAHIGASSAATAEEKAAVTAKGKYALYGIGFNVGLDLVGLFAAAEESQRPRHSFAIGAVGRMIQVPTHKIAPSFAAYSGAEPSTLGWENNRLSLGGGLVNYSFYWDGGGLSMWAQGASQLVHDDIIRRGDEFMGGVELEFYFQESFDLIFGASARQLTVDRCSALQDVCLVQGKQQTALKSLGGYIGVGAVRF